VIPKDLAIPLMDLSALANMDNPDVSGVKLNGQSMSQSDLRFFRRSDSSSDTEGFATRNAFGDIVVAFRGSEPTFFTKQGEIRDWVLTDMRANRIPYPPAPQGWPDRNWVHRGLWDAYFIVSSVVIREVQRLMDGTPRGRRIFVTGHSLGGALAYLAALDIAITFPVRVDLYSFGAPRVGDKGLNELLQSRVVDSFFVCFRGDPVPHLPPVGPNFPITLRNTVRVEIGPVTFGSAPILQINQQYRIGREIVYFDNDGRITDSYPPGLITLRFLDHLPDRYQTALDTLPVFVPSQTDDVMPSLQMLL
jgi:hypothetical protein